MIVESIISVWLSGLLFAIFHSLTASQQCKQWSYRHGLQEPTYRLIYSAIGILTTAIWLYYVHQLPDQVFYHTEGITRIILMVLQGLGLLLLLAAFHPIDGLAFLGFRKASSATDPFIVHGIYHYLRHPMYTGVMLMLLAMPAQTYNGLNFSLLVCLYFAIGSRFEEARMLRQHPDYAAYQHRIAAFIPHIRKKL